LLSLLVSLPSFASLFARPLVVNRTPSHQDSVTNHIKSHHLVVLTNHIIGFAEMQCDVHAGNGVADRFGACWGIWSPQQASKHRLATVVCMLAHVLQPLA
jgi:hypothetical protein